MHSCDESLFLALNFDGGPCLDRIMTLISGMAIWIPFYLLILWLVCRRYGWRNTLLFLAALALALVLSDMLCGIFKHSGPLKHLWADFPPRWRPMFSPALEGLDIPADSLFAWRHAGLPTPNSLVHVPAGAVAGKYGTVSSHAATIAAVVVMSAAVIRRRWFTWLGIAAALLICYSRIYLAKHFPVDLLLGTGVGILTGLFMLWLYKKSGRGFSSPSIRAGRDRLNSSRPACTADPTAPVGTPKDTAPCHLSDGRAFPVLRSKSAPAPFQ